MLNTHYSWKRILPWQSNKLEFNPIQSEWEWEVKLVYFFFFFLSFTSTQFFFWVIMFSFDCRNLWWIVFGECRMIEWMSVIKGKEKANQMCFFPLSVISFLVLLLWFDCYRWVLLFLLLLLSVKVSVQPYLQANRNAIFIYAPHTLTRTLRLTTSISVWFFSSSLHFMFNAIDCHDYSAGVVCSHRRRRCSYSHDHT